jgi:hypothetical protein
VSRIKRPNTWLHRPMLQNVKKLLPTRSRPHMARIVEEPLRDLLPDRLPAIKADRVDGLDFHRPLAAPAGDAQHMALDLRKSSLPHLGAGRAGARVSKHRIPMSRGQRLVRSRSGYRRSPDGFGGPASVGGPPA